MRLCPTEQERVAVSWRPHDRRGAERAAPSSDVFDDDRAERRGIGVIDVLVKEEFIAEERESRQPDDGGRKSVRFLRDETLRPLIFTDGKSRNVCAGSGERIGDAALAEAVAKIERVFGGEIVIEAQTKLVFVLRLRERGDKGGVACVRQRIKGENVL